LALLFYGTAGPYTSNDIDIFLSSDGDNTNNSTEEDDVLQCAHKRYDSECKSSSLSPLTIQGIVFRERFAR